MSNDQDRVAVPTNGRRPHALTIESEDTPAASPAPPAPTMTTDAPTVTEMASPVSPRSLAIGFGLIASVAVVVAGVLRRRADR
jgi:hypothetical protein